MRRLEGATWGLELGSSFSLAEASGPDSLASLSVAPASLAALFFFALRRRRRPSLSRDLLGWLEVGCGLGLGSTSAAAMVGGGEVTSGRVRFGKRGESVWLGWVGVFAFTFGLEIWAGLSLCLLVGLFLICFFLKKLETIHRGDHPVCRPSLPWPGGSGERGWRVVTGVSPLHRAIVATTSKGRD
jgi:MYXO-CTERM domain-containing protein